MVDGPTETTEARAKQADGKTIDTGMLVRPIYSPVAVEVPIDIVPAPVVSTVAPLPIVIAPEGAT